MSRMRKTIILLSLVLAACGGRERSSNSTTQAAPVKGGVAVKQGTATAAAAPEEPPEAEVKVGSKMPAYSAHTLDGKTFDLTGERGKVVLVNLWATWCGPCRAEIPALQQFQTDYAARGFDVVGISLDETGPEAVRTFVHEQKITYPVVIDEDARAMNIFRASVIPISAIVDRHGNVSWLSAGTIEQSIPAVRQEIEKALAAK